MANYFDFSSDRINVYGFVIDKSGSMENDVKNVKIGLKEYKNSFENFPELNSIVVSISKFSSDINLGDFRPLNEMDTSYSANGGTALYYSIVKGADHLKDYIAEIVMRKRIKPRATFIVFSDGKPEGDIMRREDAASAIKNLNFAGITTVFAAFGDAISSNFGKKLGFMSTCDVNNLVEFLGEELPKSCKEQSRSYKPLGANFFSKAVSNEYSHTTEQALEDNSWINDI